MTGDIGSSFARAALGVQGDTEAYQHSGGDFGEYTEIIEHMSEDPWNMLTAKDPFTGRQIIWTRDERERDDAKSRKPFPDIPYLKEVVSILNQEEIVFIPKSRQMIVSTMCMLLILHETLFRYAKRSIVSKVAEKGAKELLRDKLRAPWEMTPDWFKAYLPLSRKPQGVATSSRTQSYVHAVAENAASGELRGGTTSTMLLDEACYQDMSSEIFTAAKPAASRIWVVSSPHIGTFGGRWMKAMINDETPM